ncbi:MAG: phosphoesterase [Verrucomicrobiales bacterium]|nr:phosphoesterase [Verrucomicrobiales bacterium]
MYYLKKLGSIFAAVIFLAQATFAAEPTRSATNSVNSAHIRQTQNLTPNENLLFNGWGVTPAGQSVSIASDMPLRMIVSPDGSRLLSVSGGFNNTGLTILDTATRRVTQFLPLKTCFNGLAFSKSGHQIYVSSGGTGEIHVFNYDKGTATFVKTYKPLLTFRQTFFTGLAVHPSTGKIYVCNEAGGEVLVLNPKNFHLEVSISVGEFPHTCVMGADNVHLYVSNWGSRSVSVIDTKENRRLRDLDVDLRPNDMIVAPDGRMFVACAGENTVHVIQTLTVEKFRIEASRKKRPVETAREIISTSLYPDSPEGSTPDALALAPDGKTLFVANADNNNVAVVDISNPEASIVNGFIPSGWYPTALAVGPDNKTLYIGNGKGQHSRANYPPKADGQRTTQGVHFDYIGHTVEGSIEIVERPTPEQMRDFTAQVQRNSPYTPHNLRSAPIKSNSIIPEHVGTRCPIKHILYIIKENRTYDQLFGDFKDAAGKPAGNGDPRICIYGEPVSPNHHQLARDYVLFDNLYCNGEVSMDGHSWCDAAMATDYKQRCWMVSYSRHGWLPGNEEMEAPAAGFFWDLCRRYGLSFRNYGEGAKRVPSANRGKWPGGRDMDRVKSWIDDLHVAEKTGKLPAFTIMSLGEDHTTGTKPGTFTPDAAVASNDLGLGRIVEAASRSRFWNQMAIFVIEDDAQNGPDHVDAHRTVGLVISPWCKRNHIDSTMYSTASMVRTMELILGLPPMTQYDAGATPMFNAFGTNLVSTPYTALMPQVNMLAKNTKHSPFAAESKKMNFSEYDLAPEDELNRILWYAAKGMDADYPTPIHRALHVQ